jgi:VIT1/CCC1 family predicted Fe2+/Mn2+ transporter
VVGAASLVGCLVPIFPYLFMKTVSAGVASVSIAAVVLFVGGAYKARLTVGRPVRAGIEMACIGMTSALVGWAVGLMFGAR